MNLNFFQISGILQSLVRELFWLLNAFVKSLENCLNRTYYITVVKNYLCVVWVCFNWSVCFPFWSRYVILILPLLLVSFSDQVVAVREAAECAARAMMSQLSAQGVKLVLPSLLKVLNLYFKLWAFSCMICTLLGTEIIEPV